MEAVVIDKSSPLIIIAQQIAAQGRCILIGIALIGVFAGQSSIAAQEHHAKPQCKRGRPVSRNKSLTSVGTVTSLRHADLIIGLRDSQSVLQIAEGACPMQTIASHRRIIIYVQRLCGARI